MVLIQLALLESMSPHKSSIAAQLSVTGLFIFAMILPSFTAAQSTADLQAQIQALMAQIAAMQGSLGQTQSTSPVYEGESDDYGRDTTSEDYCPTLTVTLQYGSRDARTQGQVTDLQIYLANYFDVSEEGLVSGFFGKNTERYVKKFQQQNNLPAFGIAGSQTRAKIASLCGGVTPRPNTPFSATPTSGATPLHVNFFVDQSVGNDASIEFGDGTSCNGYGCNFHAMNPGVRTASHTYSAAGTYTARLLGANCNDTPSATQAMCDAPRVTITVGAVPPSSLSCAVSTNKNSYVLGENIDISWTSIGEPNLVHFEAPGYAKDYLNLPYVDKLKPNGSTSIQADVTGNITISLIVSKVDANGGVLYGSQCRTSIQIHQPTTTGITVTAPNGGEQWEIGQLNTITWAPYGYNPNVNPAKDVDVILEYAETRDSAGKIMDTGKASLHTYFNLNDYQTWAKPGQYYVSVVNRVTKVMDRSDAPFTLLPRGIDIKVNGSDGPLTLTDNQPVTVTFAVGESFQRCNLIGVRQTPNGSAEFDVGVGGPFKGYAYAPTPGSSRAVYITCYKSDGGTRTDSVQVNMTGTDASLKVTSPNGGEKLEIGKQANISWIQSGLKSISIALYRNDQWMKWIEKDMPFVNSDFYAWTPSGVEAEAAPLGNVFKIYVTGQKADGTGYVDDKSDAPFGFTPVFDEDAHFIALPSAGTAPLPVTFAAAVGGPGYVIDFGDGVWGGIYQGEPIAERSFSAPQHTYQKPGIYTAKLYSFPSPYTADCSRSNPDPSCSVVGTATIKVSSNVVVDPARPTCAITSPTSVESGGTATLSWTSQNATSAQFAPEWGSEPVNNTRTTVPLSETTTYTGTFTGSGGTATCTATITVTAKPAATYTISGVVWNDLNGDRVFQSSLEPRMMAETVQLQNSETGAFQSAMTGPSGGYSFSGVAAGTYRVSHLVPSGYVRTTDDSLLITVNANVTYDFGVQQTGTESADAGLANLASALTALEGALNSLLQYFAR